MTTGGVVVTGLGAVCAAGESLPRIMDSLYSGRRNPSLPTSIQADLKSDYPVFEVRNPLDDLPAIPYKREPTRTTHLALIAAEEAIGSAGLDHRMLATGRVGVCLGTTVGCTLNNEPFYRELRAGGYPDLAPVRRYLDGNPASFLAEALGCTGPVAAAANACSSGTDAIGLAKAWIETGQCDIAIAGGCDELSRIPYLGFIHLMISSHQPCLPFDKNRKGLNLGEGAGVVVLESEARSRDRSADKLASVAGYASFADAHHPTAPHPEGRGLKLAIRQALQEAELAPDEIGFVSAHGTATADNDLVEGRAVREVLGGRVPVVATKAYTGHTLGAAGALQAVFTVQALLDGRLPATAGFSTADPEIGMEPTREIVEIDARAAISNSLAFGGNNSALIFRGGLR